MSVFDNSGTQHCGVRLPGRMRAIVIDGAQPCQPQPSGRPNRDQEFAEERTDPCGQPLPYTCTPSSVIYPTCYTNPSAPAPYQNTVLPGYRLLNIAAGCNVTSVTILDEQLNPVPGALEVICEERSSLPGQPA